MHDTVLTTMVRRRFFALGVALAVVIAAGVTVSIVGAQYVLPPDREIAWSVATPPGDDEAIAQFVAHDRFVHVASTGVTTYSLENGTRSELTTHGKPCDVTERPAGRLHVFVVENALRSCDTAVAVDIATGRTAWRSKLAVTGIPDTHSDPTSAQVVDDTVYLRGVTGVQALDARTGEARWRYELPAGRDCEPEASRGDTSKFLVAVSCGQDSSERTLVALDPSTGKKRWDVTYSRRSNTDHLVSVVTVSPPLLARFVVGDSSSTTLRPFDDEGEARSTVPTEVADGRVVGTTMVGTDGDRTLSGHDVRTGRRVWSTKAADHRATLVSGGEAHAIPFVYGSKTKVYATFDPRDGTVDDGRRLPAGSPSFAEYWQAGETLLARANGTVGDGESWLVAYRPR